MFRKKIALFGYFGGQNLGDDLILSILVDSLQKIVRRSDLVIATIDPKYTSQYGIESVRLDRKWGILKTLPITRLFILGGGGLIKPNTIRYYSIWLILAKIIGSKTIMLSLGTEFRQFIGLADKISLLFACRCSDIISVRDLETSSFLKSIGVKSKIYLTNDLVFLKYNNKMTIKDSHKRDILKKRPYVILCLREFRHISKEWNCVQQSIDLDNFSTMMAQFCEYLINNKGLDIHFFVTQTGSETDQEITVEIMNQIRNKDRIFLTRHSVDLQHTIDFFKGSSCIVSMRLHPLIIGILAEVPILGIAYSEKVRTFLSENGLSDFLANINELKGSESLQLLIEPIIKDSSDNKVLLANVAEKLYNQSANNLQLLRDILGLPKN